MDMHIKMSLLSTKMGVFVDEVRDICYILHDLNENTN